MNKSENNRRDERARERRLIKAGRPRTQEVSVMVSGTEAIAIAEAMASSDNFDVSIERTPDIVAARLFSMTVNRSLMDSLDRVVYGPDSYTGKGGEVCLRDLIADKTAEDYQSSTRIPLLDCLENYERFASMSRDNDNSRKKREWLYDVDNLLKHLGPGISFDFRQLARNYWEARNVLQNASMVPVDEAYYRHPVIRTNRQEQFEAQMIRQARLRWALDKMNEELVWLGANEPSWISLRTVVMDTFTAAGLYPIAKYLAPIHVHHKN